MDLWQSLGTAAASSLTAGLTAISQAVIANNAPKPSTVPVAAPQPATATAAATKAGSVTWWLVGGLVAVGAGVVVWMLARK